MRIVCVGGGPAGLYFAISAKLRDPGHEVTVVERNPAGVTYGWGVVFFDALLDSLYRNDQISAREINDRPASWNNQEVRVRSASRVHLGGYGYAIGRHRLLDILARRADALGVRIDYEREIADLAEVADADLVVACDGANSRIRETFADHFRAGIDRGRNKYIWLGTHRMFDSFLFTFEQTSAGWMWCHSYPYSVDMTTFIVECPPETWRDLGFEDRTPEETTALLEEVFGAHLRGEPLLIPPPHLPTAPWKSFPRITNEVWYRDNVVLMGDAAHTTHFSIGSGTTLAMQDAVGLADALHRNPDLPTALAAYQRVRQEELLVATQAAHNSTLWFENIPAYVEREPAQFAYELLRRRGHYPSWRYPLHLATQVPALRGVRTSISLVRRMRLTRRRLREADCDLPARAGVTAGEG